MKNKNKQQSNGKGKRKGSISSNQSDRFRTPRPKSAKDSINFDLTKSAMLSTFQKHPD